VRDLFGCMNKQHLLQLATRFYAAIESLPPEDRTIGLLDFPDGSCGDASLLFGAYLIDKGVTGFMYVCGQCGDHSQGTWTTHAWLQKERLIIDITARQFSDAPSPIIVEDPSPWHDGFITDPPSPSDFRQGSGIGVEDMKKVYLRLKTKMDGLP
jgi:hypothetical protein